MAIHPLPSARVAFGPFELDASGSELRKSGVRLRLTGQPFEILLVLLAHPGEVVTREQLRERIWKEGTFVDFEHGLSAAMNKLRRSLGDSADNPRYIETVPGRGYRFIGLVQERSSVAAVAPVSHEMLTEVADQVAKPDSRKSWLAIGAVTGGVFVACLVMWMALQRPVSRSDVRVQQLTTNSAENPIWRAVISPDGRYLAYGDQHRRIAPAAKASIFDGRRCVVSGSMASGRDANSRQFDHVNSRHCLDGFGDRRSGCPASR